MDAVLKGEAVRYVRRDKGKHTGISMLNLIDVIFVLLLFFMLTTSFNKFAHIDIALPQSASNLNEEDKKNVEVFYLLNGEVLFEYKRRAKKLKFDESKRRNRKFNPEAKREHKTKRG